jgi:hypothetical protein
MKPVVSPLLRSTRLILPAAALLAALGGTAVIATPAQAGISTGPARSAPARPATSDAKLTWHPFKLLNGWKSATAKKLLTGTPAWALQNGVVYLRGAVRRPTAGNTPFASLPKQARPVSNLYNQVFSKADVPAVLFIDTDGAMTAYNGNADAFTSLSGLSYPTVSVKSHKFKLLNGWLSSQPTYETGDPSYAISKGVVYLSGSMHTGGTSPLAFILPKAARPAHALFISVYTVDGSTGEIEIEPQGEVDISGVGSAGYTSLATISFPVAATKWHKFKLTSGWKPFTKFGSAVPAYAVVNGIVYLDGAMDQAPAGTGLWTILPAATRTVHVVDIEVLTTSGSVGALTLTSNPGVVGSMPASNAQTKTSHDGVAYPPSS